MRLQDISFRLKLFLKVVKCVKSLILGRKTPFLKLMKLIFKLIHKRTQTHRIKMTHMHNTHMK